MPEYVNYLNASLPDRQAKLAARKEQFARMQQELAEQQAKNYGGAPVVSGGGGSMANAQAIQAALSQIKAGGGKVNPVTGRVSQNWGKSRIKYSAGRHTGMDFAVPVGSTVRSAASGVVTRVGSQGAYGNTVMVRHKDGTTALYAHLAGSGVKAGQRVKAGQAIARSGNTGRSTGAHLHFEIRTRDRYGSDIDPRSWLSR